MGRAATSTRPSWQSRLASAYLRRFVRRHDWGDTWALARRARRHFGLPPALQGLVLRGLAQRPVTVDGVQRGEWIAAPGAAPRGVLLYVHGGGYVSCSAATHRAVTAELARRSGLRVLGADYRIAPEAPFPAALDDVLALYRWLVTTGAPGEPVALAGESAGGGLVLALAQQARDAGLPMPRCIASLSPWTDLAGTGDSIRANDGRCALFRPPNFPAFARAYLGDASPEDPRAAPLHGDPRGLPPVLLHVGSTEMLLDDARRMHASLLAAGGESRLAVWEDQPHGWHLLAPWVPEAGAALDDVAGFVRAHVGPSDGNIRHGRDRAPAVASGE